MQPYPPFNLFLIFPQGVEGNKDYIPGADALEILQPLHKNIGQTVIGQYHIPVVANGDGRGYHPCMMDMLPLHAIPGNRDAGQRFTASLFPLEQAVFLLQHQIDVVFLQIV